MSRTSADHLGERGSAVVEFVLVSALVTLLLAGVLQLALALHVRSTLVDCAAEGARHGALADRGPDDAVRRTVELIRASLHDRYAQDVVAGHVRRDGLDLVQVRVTAPLPVLGLLGPGGVLTVEGHALEEAP